MPRPSSNKGDWFFLTYLFPTNHRLNIDSRLIPSLILVRTEPSFAFCSLSAAMNASVNFALKVVSKVSDQTGTSVFALASSYFVFMRTSKSAPIHGWS